MTQDQKAYLEGDGALAQGNRNVVAGKQGIAISGHGNTVTVTVQGVEIAIPAPDAVKTHRKALRSSLEQQARWRWGSMASYIQEDVASLPLEASPYQIGDLGRPERLLPALRKADRMILLGGPGTGKSVSLERLAWELCGTAASDVPVLLPLFRYDGAPLAAWIRAYLQETGCLRLDNADALTAFLKESPTRCFFLFDGLNEVRPSFRDKLVGELDRWMKSYDRHPVVITSRAQDELWRRLRSTEERVLVVQPIAADQVRAYLQEHLGCKGTALYGSLDEPLREMACTPLILWLIKEAAQAGESIPGNRGELYARFVSRMLRRDTDRRMDADIPERHKREVLTELAYHLGSDESRICPREEAVTAVTQRCLGFDETRVRELLDACLRHGLLAGAEELWFAPHQTVQEYFMALALKERWGEERERSALHRWWRGVRRRLGQTNEDVLAKAASDWWMETFVQLAGLVDDADDLVLDVSRVNPGLALWCVGEGRAVSEATQGEVEDRSIAALDDRRLVARRRAVEALSRISSERVIEPLLRAAGDPDREISSIAVQALGQLGEGVKPRAVQALQNQDSLLAVLRYAVAYPDEELCARHLPTVLDEVLGLSVVWVPGGPFLMGSDQEKDPEAYDDEFPQHQVTLPGYWIGRTPVTVAQYRAFVEESSYASTSKESLEGPPDHPVTDVTWHDALAYCRWLDEHTGLPVMLPSEAEWEKAARGTDGCIYPWGNQAPAQSLCNNEGGTTPVGRYSPQGNSPYGCVDMTGNVWEWTRSLCRDYPYDSEDGREDLEAGDDVLRVLRGGAFGRPSQIVRCAYRDWFLPDFDNWLGGFRVVVSVRQDKLA